MHVHLEPLGQEHLEFVRSLRNSLRDNFFDTKPVTRAEQQQWYRRYLKSRTTLFWMVYSPTKTVNLPIGTICRDRLGYASLTSDSIPEVVCPVYEIGNLMLLPEYQGKGIMAEAVQQIISHGTIAFYCAHVKPTNASSLRLFKRAGFWRVPRKQKKRRPRAR